MRKTNVRCYSHLSQLSSFDDRLSYLRIGGTVGSSTFGSDRFVNQDFYHSREWRRVRDLVITRDLGCDLGIIDREIAGQIYVHHMNPITLESFEESKDAILDPEFLICCSFDTHQAIHFGYRPRIPSRPIERHQNDTCPWKL